MKPRVVVGLRRRHAAAAAVRLLTMNNAGMIDFIAGKSGILTLLRGENPAI